MVTKWLLSIVGRHNSQAEGKLFHLCERTSTEEISSSTHKLKVTEPQAGWLDLESPCFEVSMATA